MIRNTAQIVLLSLLFSVTFTVSGQIHQEPVEDTVEVEQHERFIQVVENALLEYYKEFSDTQSQVDSMIHVLGYEEQDVPEFPDSIYCERIKEMGKKSPMYPDCNQYVLNAIKFFAKSRREFTSVALGRSQLYFNLFEEKLSHHELPLELKYLSVIESGLRPQIKSRAGALGLWQFMYRTGKFYGLDQNSYVDERMNPELATEAACQYLKKLHSLYDDWYMALAAYNAGPGNVNKAIRRSGGKTNYWEIRPFLPRETQGYVPNFIAMSYMMTYYGEHNISVREPKIYDFEVDTVCLTGSLHMEVIDSLINWSVEDIQMLNPIYKTTYIPETTPAQCIQIPSTYLSAWIAMEDSIYTLDSLIYESVVKEEKAAPQAATTIHYVRKGQTLGHIAGMYGTTVNNIMAWNNMRSTNLAIGQKLTIYASGKQPDVAQKRVDPAPSTPKTEYKEPTTGTLYTIQSGDNLWSIAKNKNTTVESLEQLNPGLNPRDLKVGQKIRVK